MERISSSIIPGSEAKGTKVTNVNKEPALLRIPPELRLLILRTLIGGHKRNLNLQCCNSCTEDAINIRRAESPRSPQLEVPAGVRGAVALIKASKGLYTELQPELFRGASAEFCSDRTCYGSYDVHGLGAQYPAYLPSCRDQLRRDLQPFAHVRLAIYVRKGATCTPLTSVHIAHLLKGMFPYLDNMRLFVDALNSSRALKSFSLCITIVAPMAPPTVTGIRHILTPFEGLRTDIKFDIHFHHMDCGVIYQGSEMLSIDLKPSSPEDVAYVERLEYQRGTLPAQGFGLPLVKEWIHFRTWLLAFFTEALPTRILDNLIYNVLVTDEDKQEILDLGRALNMPDNDGAVDPQAGYDLIRQMIIDIWMAHNTGDQTAFKQAKLAFHDWYMKAQTKTLQIMLDGPPRTSSGEEDK